MSETRQEGIQCGLQLVGLVKFLEKGDPLPVVPGTPIPRPLERAKETRARLRDQASSPPPLLKPPPPSTPLPASESPPPHRLSSSPCCH